MQRREGKKGREERREERERGDKGTERQGGGEKGIPCVAVIRERVSWIVHLSVMGTVCK